MGVDKTGVDKMGVDKMGVDEMGVDEMGVDKRGIDKTGVYRRNGKTPTIQCAGVNSHHSTVAHQSPSQGS